MHSLFCWCKYNKLFNEQEKRVQQARTLQKQHFARGGGYVATDKPAI